jgi:hypothetical protein
MLCGTPPSMGASITLIMAGAKFLSHGHEFRRRAAHQELSRHSPHLSPHLSSRLLSFVHLCQWYAILPLALQFRTLIFDRILFLQIMKRLEQCELYHLTKNPSSLTAYVLVGLVVKRQPKKSDLDLIPWSIISLMPIIGKSIKMTV